MIFEKLKKLIVEQVGVEKDEITMESSFVDDLGFDSLDVVEFLIGIEEEFDIEIPDSEAERINTVGQAVEYIQRKVS
jgi:acyl carrier protein